ncbi:hypothetical protein C2845_PM15G20980 [Panicum miliaceum]|uniref:Uncharacterized protein n=1 Tax=Panicum miliaceum TaxID=4540 RepID=A0A3L6Q7P3_PANMI|nr:hypothetical protein C2845_PM15G20980 [Panicum miliaceum]
MAWWRKKVVSPARRAWAAVSTRVRIRARNTVMHKKIYGFPKWHRLRCTTTPNLMLSEEVNLVWARHGAVQYELSRQILRSEPAKELAAPNSEILPLLVEVPSTTTMVPIPAALTH